MNFLSIPAGKYFISHAYRDVAVRDKLLSQLPSSIEPFIFPPINVSPLEFVSNALIEAILACDGMIYLNEGASAKSFWVAFERDYALRADKPVFSYTPSKITLSHHAFLPLDLVVFASYARKDLQTIMPILQFMREHRHFDVWIDSEQIQPGEVFVNSVEQGLNRTIERGGYVT